VAQAAPANLSRFLKRPRVLAALAVVLVGAAVGGTQLWAWYHLSAGRSALADARTEDARAHLSRCLAVWPSNQRARLLAAHAARRAGDLKEAQRHLDEAQRATGGRGSEEVALEWALLRATLGDLEPVEEPLQARLEREPALGPLVWEALAEGYRRVSRVQEALALVNRWLQVEPGNPQALYQRGEIHSHVGALNKAADDYREVVEKRPEHHEARRRLVRCLVSIGRFEEALEHVAALRPVPAEDPELLVHAARCHHNLGHKDQAQEILEGVLAAHPTHGLALHEMGRQVALTGDDVRAEDWLRKAVEAVPQHYAAVYALAQCLQRQGKAEAKTCAANAAVLKERLERVNEIRRREMTLRPLDPVLHAEMGGLMLALGEKEVGRRWLLSALRLDPNLAAAHAALADHYEQEGDPTRAAIHRRQAAAASASPRGTPP
jgi:tetratricopeptide (TPR) repeat protein